MISRQSLRIGCWNVNSLRVRLEAVRAWLRSQAIDVALLQETKVQDPDFPHQPFENMGYACAVWGQKSYNGVAIVSRLPLADITRLDWSGTQQARSIYARLGEWHVVTVYVPQGQSVHAPAFQDKKDFLTRLIRHVRLHERPTEPWIIAGDWNIAPTDLDVVYAQKWANHVMCTWEERALLRHLTTLGWGDAAAMHGRHDPTWWHYRHGARERQDGLRIDLGLLNPAARDRCVGYDVCPQWRDQDRPSDHAPWHVDVLARPLWSSVGS